MQVFGMAIVCLVLGAAGGVVLALRRRQPDQSLALEGWFEAHAAELRRLGDEAD